MGFSNGLWLGPETYTYPAKRYPYTYTMMRRVRRAGLPISQIIVAIEIEIQIGVGIGIGIGIDGKRGSAWNIRVQNVHSAAGAGSEPPNWQQTPDRDGLATTLATHRAAPDLAWGL
jgi:hypothetical protein